METDAETPDPAAALDLVAAARSDLADRLVTPWWYHPVLGVLVGGLIASQALPTPMLRVLAIAPYALGLTLLVKAYQRLTGVWANGLRPGPARPWAVGLGVAMAAALALAGLARVVWGWTAAPVVAGVIVIPIVIAIGRQYDRVLRADLRASA